VTDAGVTSPLKTASTSMSESIALAPAEGVTPLIVKPEFAPTVTCTAADVPVWPVLFVAIADRAYGPPAPGDHVMRYGAAVTVPTAVTPA
jgi:hypothetical protein